MKEKELIWIRDNWLLLETEKGNAFVQTQKNDYYDDVPCVHTNAPIWTLCMFSDPNEQDERTTLNVTLSQSQVEKLMNALANEIERFAKVTREAEDELAEITSPKESSSQ